MAGWLVWIKQIDYCEIGLLRERFLTVKGDSGDLQTNVRFMITGGMLCV